jgi:hypothetical protein
MEASAIKPTISNRYHQRLMTPTADIKKNKLLDVCLVCISQSARSHPSAILSRKHGPKKFSDGPPLSTSEWQALLPWPVTGPGAAGGEWGLGANKIKQ